MPPKRQTHLVGYGLALIELTLGQLALVDECLADELSQNNWASHNRGYAYRTARNRSKVLLHREVYELSGGALSPELQVDHVNGDRLDCRLCNLRLVTDAQNHYNVKKRKNNTSGHKGVSYDSRRGLYRARIHYECRERWLGYYDTAEEASQAYEREAQRIFGEFKRGA